MSRLASLQALLAQGRDGALLRFSLGAEHLQGGQADEARAHLERAVALDAGYSAAWKLLGQACEGCGDRAAALAAYARGIETAERKGDVQAAREMRVFLRRVERTAPQA